MLAVEDESVGRTGNFRQLLFTFACLLLHSLIVGEDIGADLLVALSRERLKRGASQRDFAGTELSQSLNCRSAKPQDAEGRRDRVSNREGLATNTAARNVRQG